MIGPFRGNYFFLSNMYSAPVTLDIRTYPCAETAFQAYKTEWSNEKDQFLGLNGYEARKLGRRIPLRKDWEKIKDDVMLYIIKAKFEQNADLRLKLFATGNEELIEINSWGDTYWGVCNGKGLNKLGKILMQVREELRECYSEV